jgi:hypothetical protein
MNSSGQLIFDFSSKEPPPPPPVIADMKYSYIKRAVLGWTITQKPTGLGEKVPTRFSRYQADIAAFWSVPRKKMLHPARTVIVELRNHREKCWPDCSNKDELLPKLKLLKEQKHIFEAEIRRTEPELRDSDTLFDEFDLWDYDKSKNTEYQKCRKQIEQTEHALYTGSRFEQIRCAHVANELYLAVPENAVHPHELADGWGLLYIGDNFEVTVEKPAAIRDCPEINKFHLIQKIASSNVKSALFANGITISGTGNPVYTPLPHRRRPSQKK